MIRTNTSYGMLKRKGDKGMNVLEKILEEIKKLKRNQCNLNQDFYIGYMSALSTLEGFVAGLNDGWIPVEDTEHTPENESYVLVSFSNFSLPDIARYEENDEGGTYYPGDEDTSYSSIGFFVNAWQPLPEPYKPKKNIPVEGMDHIMRRFTKVE